MLVSTWKLWQKAGLPVPALGSWVWFFMCGVWIAAMVVVGRRYR